MHTLSPPGPGWYAAGFRVRYAETDAAGIVHHAAYLPWFEEGRSELSRQVGLPYVDLERSGITLVLTRAEARYLTAAHYDDEVTVWTRMRDVRSRSCAFDYRVVRTADGQLLATGSTEHLAVDRASGRPARLPDAVLAGYRRVAEQSAPPSGHHTHRA